MFTDQITNEVTNQVLDSVINVSESICEPSRFMMLGALLMPLLLLLIFTSIKYLVAVGIDRIDFVDFFAEMAIDLLSIFSSFIIGRYFLESNTTVGLLTACKVLLFISVCVIFVCYIRRKVMSLRETSKKDVYKKIRSLIIGEYILDIVSLVLIVIFL